MPYTIVNLSIEVIRSTLALKFPGIVENQHYRIEQLDYGTGTLYLDIKAWNLPSTQHPGMYQVNQWAQETGVQQAQFDDVVTVASLDYNSQVEEYRREPNLSSGRVSTITEEKKRLVRHWDTLDPTDQVPTNPDLTLVYNELNGILRSGQPWGFLPDGSRMRINTDANLIENWRAWGVWDDDLNASTEEIRANAKATVDGEIIKNQDDPNYLDITIIQGVSATVAAELAAL